MGEHLPRCVCRHLPRCSRGSCVLACIYFSAVVKGSQALSVLQCSLLSRFAMDTKPQPECDSEHQTAARMQFRARNRSQNAIQSTKLQPECNSEHETAARMRFRTPNCSQNAIQSTKPQPECDSECFVQESPSTFCISRVVSAKQDT